MNWDLKVGDCREQLRLMDECSVDAVVTDPPYELGFMGKKWDASGIAYSVELWREVLRVLKPGGHLLAFGGTRTYHRMTCAIEDAGFEIRDSLHWLYGTGFPKSLDVSKAIDKDAGAEREVIGTGQPFGKGSMRNRSRVEQGYRPTELNPDGGAATITAPATDAARQWSGWGTALKPGHEPIVLARKPLAGTVAQNVEKYGTGALNIDASRIGDETITQHQKDMSVYHGNKLAAGASTHATGVTTTTVGRWPANVLLDEDAAAELDEQTEDVCHSAGSARDGSTAKVSENYNASSYELPPNRNMRRLGDSGGASRFFYVAKPSRAERDRGCEHLPARSAGEATDREDGSAGLNSPRAGAGRTSGARNYHPTVKPVQLMRYLVRLITPPGGLVLDPFTGSGTTGIAALQEGFKFLGIDLDPEYARLALARIEEDMPLFNRRRT